MDRTSPPAPSFSLETVPSRHSGISRHAAVLRRARWQVVFIKTHKTASTTVTNVLMRYGLHHGLRFALPARERWHIFTSARASIQPSIFGKLKTADVLAQHCRYGGWTARVLPDALYVTIMRPVEARYRSAVAFYTTKSGKARVFWKSALGNEVWQHCQNGTQSRGSCAFSALQLANDAQLETLPVQVRHLLFNSFSFDLGLESTSLCPRGRADLDRARRHAEQIRDRFLVLLTDRVYDSLTILARQLGLGPTHIISLALNSGPKSASPGSAQSTSASAWVLEHNALDAAMFEVLNATANAKLDYELAHGGAMHRRAVARASQRVSGMCRSPDGLAWLPLVAPDVITRPCQNALLQAFCQELLTIDSELVHDIRQLIRDLDPKNSALGVNRPSQDVYYRLSTLRYAAMHYVLEQLLLRPASGPA